MKEIVVATGVDQDAEPIFIVLTGRGADGDELEPRRFRCLAEPRGATFLALMDAWSAERENRRLGDTDVIDFIESCIHPADAQRFHDTLHKGEMVVGRGQISELFMGLLEAYAGRPTVQPSLSPSGSVATSPTSTAASPWAISKSSAMEESDHYSTPRIAS